MVFPAGRHGLDRGKGDSDGDGFLGYARAAETGLANQGWKDSAESVFHADGSEAAGPIALVEVQGYVHAAFRAMADLARRRGEPGRATAGRRKRRNCGWRSSAGSGSRSWAPTRSPSTAPGGPAGCRPPIPAICCSRGCLRRTGPNGSRPSSWAPASARAGGSARSPRARPANPMSYHNGSVWPHDTALCAAGMARYGARDGVARLLTGMFEAAVKFEMRFPELFCGFARQAASRPSPIPWLASRKPGPRGRSSCCCRHAWGCASTAGAARSTSTGHGCPSASTVSRSGTWRWARPGSTSPSSASANGWRSPEGSDPSPVPLLSRAWTARPPMVLHRMVSGAVPWLEDAPAPRTRSVDPPSSRLERDPNVPESTRSSSPTAGRRRSGPRSAPPRHTPSVYGTWYTIAPTGWAVGVLRSPTRARPNSVGVRPGPGPFLSGTTPSGVEEERDRARVPAFREDRHAVADAVERQVDRGAADRESADREPVDAGRQPRPVDVDPRRPSRRRSGRGRPAAA